MRHTIWKKDDFFEVAGKRIDMSPDVVDLPLIAPLVRQFNFEDPRGAYGEVTHIDLVDGEITGEVRFFDPTFGDDTLEALQCRLGGFYKNILFLDEAKTQVLSARLIGVSIMLQSQTPGFKKENAS